MGANVIKNETGYIHYDGKLQSYKLLSAEFSIENPIVRYKAEVGGVVTTINAENLKVYSSESDFKKGLFSMQVVQDSQIGAALPHTYNNIVWMFCGGKAMPIDRNDVMLIYHDGKVKASNNVKYYATEKEVYKHHDFIVKEENGDERVVESLATKMRMTSEQEEIVGKITEMLLHAKQMGLVFFYDGECSKLKVGNMSKVEYDVACGYDISEEEQLDCLECFFTTLDVCHVEYVYEELCVLPTNR